MNSSFELRFIILGYFGFSSKTGCVKKFGSTRMDHAVADKARRRRQTSFSNLQRRKAIFQLGRSIVSLLSLDAVCREFVAGIRLFVPHDRILISRLDSRDRISRLFVSPLSPEDGPAVSPETFGSAKSVSQWVIQEKKAFVRQDTSLQQEFEIDSRLIQMGLHSYIALPLFCKHRLIGILELASKKPSAFGEPEISFLTPAVEWLAIAVENALFFQESYHLLEELGVLHQVTSQLSILELESSLQKIADEVRNHFNADCAYLRLREPDGSFPVRAVSGTNWFSSQQPNLTDQGESFWPAGNRNPLIIRDLRKQNDNALGITQLDQLGFRSYVGVPLTVREEVIGRLAVLYKSARDFADRDMLFLQRLAGEAAVAIHRARLFHELQRAARELESIALRKSEFLSYVAHEIKTPLNVIMGLLDLISVWSTAPLSERQALALNKVQDQCQTLVKMANDVLTLSRIETGTIPLEISSFRIERVIEPLRTLTDALQNKSRLKVVWNVEPGLPSLTTDASKLETVLQNLIVNAFKFTAEGEVRIGIRSGSESNSIQLVVADTGRGIAPENLSEIFKEYHQVHLTHPNQGVGLGLRIVKKYLELIKGRIQVESELGKGSTFTATVPCSL